MTRREKIQRVERIRNRYEKAFYSPLKKVLENQLSSFTDDLHTYGVEQARTRLNASMWNNDVSVVVNQLYIEVGLAMANQTLGDLRILKKREQKRRTFGYNEEWTNQIVLYFSRHLFDKVVLPISETTKDYILAVITEGVNRGWSIEEMVAKIEREDYLDGRVRRILRTEINRAINYGNTLAEQKYEFKTQKRWVAVHDNRTRHAHLAADGQTVEMDTRFSVGGEQLDFPGDPDGSAENTINCRCHTELVAVRDGEGRLIPKKPQGQVRVRGRLRRELQDILNELQ